MLPRRATAAEKGKGKRGAESLGGAPFASDAVPLASLVARLSRSQLQALLLRHESELPRLRDEVTAQLELPGAVWSFLEQVRAERDRGPLRVAFSACSWRLQKTRDQLGCAPLAWWCWQRCGQRTSVPLSSRGGASLWAHTPRCLTQTLLSRRSAPLVLATPASRASGRARRPRRSPAS
jgi:hypothetical protein